MQKPSYMESHEKRTSTKKILNLRKKHNIQRVCYLDLIPIIIFLTCPGLPKVNDFMFFGLITCQISVCLFLIHMGLSLCFCDLLPAYLPFIHLPNIFSAFMLVCPAVCLHICPSVCLAPYFEVRSLFLLLFPSFSW